MKTVENTNPIFPKGQKAPQEYFTGTAWLNILVPKDETGSYTVVNVEFEPGGKTNWHTHPAGQILLVTQESGYYQERGKPARVLVKGDVVCIPSHLEHWHGAAPDSTFTHIAITNLKENVSVEWLMPVSEEEYKTCDKM